MRSPEDRRSDPAAAALGASARLPIRITVLAVAYISRQTTRLLFRRTSPGSSVTSHCCHRRRWTSSVYAGPMMSTASKVLMAQEAVENYVSSIEHRNKTPSDPSQIYPKKNSQPR